MVWKLSTSHRVLRSVHAVPQAEGGEQGDPLMPLLFAVDQYQALEVVKDRLSDGHLPAYLDDTHIVS